MENETKEERIQRLVKEGIEKAKHDKNQNFKPPQSSPSSGALFQVVGGVLIAIVVFAIISVVGGIACPECYNPFENFIFGNGGTNTNAIPRAVPALNPARDLTGSWSGTFKLTENSDTPCCTTTGKVSMTIQQTGNKFTGTYTFRDLITISKTEELNSRSAGGIIKRIAGTIGGTRIEFNDRDIKFYGDFTSDMLKFNYESCERNKQCSDTSHSGVSDGIEYVSVSSPGIVGVMTLTRDRD